MPDKGLKEVDALVIISHFRFFSYREIPGHYGPPRISCCYKGTQRRDQSAFEMY